MARAEVLSIRPSYSTIYTANLNPVSHSRSFIQNMVHLKNNAVNKLMSKKAAGNARNAIDWLLYQAKDKTVYAHKTDSYYKFKVNFVTLTLSSSQFYDDRCDTGGNLIKRHSDQEIKREVLGPFLDLLRKTHDVKNYVWRAEAQPGTGNIHFHLLTDQFIHWRRIRDIWNNAQERLGYITRFETRNGHRDPNSIDVKSVKKIQKLAGYLVAYMTKKAKGRLIEGRQWFLSETLQKLSAAKIFLQDTSESLKLILQRMPAIDKKVFDYCTVIYKPIQEIIQHCSTCKDMIKTYLLGLDTPAPPEISYI